MAKYPIILLILAISILSPVLSSAQQHKAPQNIALFTDIHGKYLYRARIEFKDKEISGILIIKKSDSNSYRIAMVTELGMKIFEMEFFANKERPFIMHSCIKYLNKKIIINTLKTDFESLFINFGEWKNPKIIYQENGYIYRYCYKGKRDYICNLGGDISKIVRRSWFLEKEEILITNIKNPYPQSIIVKHQHIKLNIQLSFIK